MRPPYTSRSNPSALFGFLVTPERYVTPPDNDERIDRAEVIGFGMRDVIRQRKNEQNNRKTCRERRVLPENAHQSQISPRIVIVVSRNMLGGSSGSSFR